MQIEELLKEENVIRKGGKGLERQKKLGRLTARERLEKLFDPGSWQFELGLFVGWGMYQDEGGLPAGGVITTLGNVSGKGCMVIANDATVKAGAFFPPTVKKVLRAQRVAFQLGLPIIYLVDSSGVYLPLQDEIFPDEDDFGRIFRNNSVLSALGIPQYAAIMGSCIAGGGYLPVLCDQLLMTEGSGLYLAGPALVEAAIGQKPDVEELGGAKMHASVSGTVDFLAKDDESCLKKLRELMAFLPENYRPFENEPSTPPFDATGEYDVRALLETILDEESFIEYKADFGKTIVTGFGRLKGHSVGIVASQKKRVETARGEIEIGGVIYKESADKAARFVMECNQMGLPLIFFQDVMGFMVGREAEQGGIIRSGAKLVNAISNSIVPKMTVIVGSSFGAGHYALCGKAYDPELILAWPSARYAVMGKEQASKTLFNVQKDLKNAEEMKKLYAEHMDIRYGAARGWVDAIIDPKDTRSILASILPFTKKRELSFHTGVLQT